MTWLTLAPWVNRIGMLFEFLSFWFAAPEVISEIRNDDGLWLESVEQAIDRFIIVFSLIFLILPIIFTTISNIIFNTIDFIARNWYRIRGIKYSSPPRTQKERFFRANVKRYIIVRFTFLLLGVLLIITIIMAILNKPYYWVPNIIGLAVIISAIVFSGLMAIVRKLREDHKNRRRALITGVLLFGIGFIMQFIATF